MVSVLRCGAGASPFSTANSQHESASIPLLALQDIMATVQLQDAPGPTTSPPAPASEGSAGQLAHEPALQGLSSGSKIPAETDMKGIGGAPGSKHASVPPSPEQKTPSRKLIRAGLELEGLRAVFDAEAVFAACQIAEDAVAVHEQLESAQRPAAQGQQASAAAGPNTSLGSPEQELKQAGSMPAAPLKRAGPSLKSSKYELEVSARLSDLQGEARLSETICWGVRVQAVSAALGPRCAVVDHVALSLNSAQLITLGAAVLTAHVPGVFKEPSPEKSPWLLLSRAESAEDLGRALTGAILPPRPRAEPYPDRTPDFDESSLLDSASHMNSIVTDLDAEGEVMPYDMKCTYSGRL